MDQLDLFAPAPATPAPAPVVVPQPIRPNTCRCGVGPFTNRGVPGRPWWVHATCGLPTASWLASAEARTS